jgi:catechol 2,3-dioxygenase-like lactoylglutathione lyase family enzyme
MTAMTCESATPLDKSAAGPKTRLNRRQFMQTLGAGAAITLGACSGLGDSADAANVTNATNATKGLTQATAVNHLAYAVTNYARTRDFYVDLFGMKVAWDDGTKCSVEFGDPARPEAFYLVAAKPGEKAYINHTGYSIANFMAHKGAIEAELKRRNIRYRGDTEQGWTLNDPSGYTIHFISEKDIFPGAAEPCAVMNSAQCKAAEAAGLKNLDRLPQPGGKGFKATAFSHIVQCVRNLDETRAFYEQLFGMRPLHYKAGESNAQAMLRFGNNTLILANSQRPGPQPYVDHFALEIENFELARVEAELRRRGYNPRPYTKLGWAIEDPEGTRIEIASKGWPDYVARTCNGIAANCPG